jgi:hypothetical protein
MKIKNPPPSLLRSVLFITVVVFGLLTIIGTGDTDPPPASRITQFSATPTVICPGETVTLNWEAEGTSATLAGGTVALTGTTTVTPTGPLDASYELSVDSGAARGVIRINVITDGEPVNLSLDPVCDAGTGRFQDRWVGDLEVSPIPSGNMILSRSLLVETVFNNWDRDLMITHDGLTERVNVRPDASTAWNNHRPTGAWDARWAPGTLTRLYSCPGAVGTSAPPPAVPLVITLKCP